MTKSRLGSFVEKLSAGLKAESDPFGDDYFDPVAYEKQRVAEEPKVIEEALTSARFKASQQEKMKAEVKHREPVRFRRDWE